MKLRLRKDRAILFIVLLSLLAMYLIPLTVQAYQESLLVDGYELKVDGKSWFIVDDKDKLNTLLLNYKMTRMVEVDEGTEVLGLSFMQNIEIVDVRVDDDVFTDYETAAARINAIEKEAVYYTVVKGDNLWDISRKNNIELARLIQLNPAIDPERIWAGNKLLFEPADPVLDVMVEVKTIVEESIPFTTQYIKDNSLYKHERVVSKKGVEGTKEVTYQIAFLNGYKYEIEILNEVELSAPVGSIVKIGSKPTLARTTGSNYGVVHGTFTSGFGYRIDPISGRRAFHDGIDIAAPYGTLVYAYTDGTVVAAGWNNTRGYYVTISHNGGIQTNYLHLSKVLVRTGDKVVVGQKIGKVGSTGYSTGNHLHFSVKKNGKMVSPWSYI